MLLLLHAAVHLQAVAGGATAATAMHGVKLCREPVQRWQRSGPYQAVSHALVCSGQCRLLPHTLLALHTSTVLSQIYWPRKYHHRGQQPLLGCGPCNLERGADGLGTSRAHGPVPATHCCSTDTHQAGRLRAGPWALACATGWEGSDSACSAASEPLKGLPGGRSAGSSWPTSSWCMGQS